jgi:branched-chain amino acid transport system ATP-binding protein
VNRAGLARTFQNIRLFKEMSVLENLLVAQHMWVNRNMLAGILNTKGYRKAESDALDHAFYWLEVVDLVDCANRLAGELSYGQQRRLESPGPCARGRRSSASTNRPPASTLRKPKR